ncbi:uncharacterized protein V1510DRAFT_229087 [Dipodascopsis tothii]|uniref:uncharacterized protein n=1 Tax=Dipodascopsis tothii TaxID=44089 RepID=UPI0034CDBB05
MSEAASGWGAPQTAAGARHRVAGVAWRLRVVTRRLRRPRQCSRSGRRRAPQRRYKQHTTGNADIPLGITRRQEAASSQRRAPSASAKAAPGHPSERIRANHLEPLGLRMADSAEGHSSPSALVAVTLAGVVTALVVAMAAAIPSMELAQLQQLPRPLFDLLRPLAEAVGLPEPVPLAAGTAVPRGLVNPGNTCFMNAVVQAFASLESVTGAVAAAADAARAPATRALAGLLAGLNAGDGPGALSTRPLLASLQSAKWTPDTDQQDAHEFLLALVEALRAEADAAAAAERAAAVALDAVVHGPAGAAAEAAASAAARRLPLDGLLLSRVACLDCTDSPALAVAPFSTVELALPFGVLDADLRACLADFTAAQTLQNVQCHRCSLQAAHAHLGRLLDSEKCVGEIRPVLAARRDAIADVLAAAGSIPDAVFDRLKPPRLVAASKTKQAVFARLPAALALHINRSDYDPRLGIARKNTARLAYDEVLDMAAFTADVSADVAGRADTPLATGVVPIPYRLRAVVVHFGTHSFGHYVCYRRFHDTWFRISDKTVAAVTVAEVLSRSSGVVMLFYERDPAPGRPWFWLTERPRSCILGWTNIVIN